VSVKTTGAEYKAYVNETNPEFWPDGAWYDDVILSVNGVVIGDDVESVDPDKLTDSDKVEIICGTYYRHSEDADPISLETHFKRWRKAQTHVYISVQVHRDKLDAVKAAIKASGGSVTL